MPRMMYGTAWKKERTAELVYQAIKAGFRGFDTAAMGKHYREDLVGEGIRRAISDGIVTRRDLYVSPHLFMSTCPPPPPPGRGVGGVRLQFLSASRAD